MRIILLASCLFVSSFTIAQDEIPFAEIPPAPESYTASNVLARMIEGLGFRYRWATEDLSKEDLAYQLSESSRTLDETLEHIFGLSNTIINAVEMKPNVQQLDETEMSYEDRRMKTLGNLQRAALKLRASDDADIENMNIVFQRGETTSSFSFWYNINGPIADAIWHTGQVVASRRASGNPFSSKVSVFMGKVRQ